MSKTLLSLAAALALMSGTASAQTVQSVLQAASKAMGADNLKCITYSGTSGYVGIVGQAHDIRDDWPKVEISNYTRTINYDAKSSYEDRTSPTGQSPARWRRRHPAPGRSAAAGNYVVDKSAWNMGRAGKAEPAAGAGRPAAGRHLDEPAWFLQGGHGAGCQSGAASRAMKTARSARWRAIATAN